MGWFKKIKNYISDDEERYNMLFQSKELRASVMDKNPQTYLNANDLCLYVNKALQKRAEKVAEINFVLESKKGENIMSHPILDLLYKPNKLHTGAQFWELYQKFKDIYGEVFLLLSGEREFMEKNKKVKELHLLDPRYWEPVYDLENLVFQGIKYIGVSVKTGATTFVEAKDVIYDFRPDPGNILRGCSLLKSGLLTIDIANQLEEYQANVLHHGGKIDGVFTFKGISTLTRKQLDDLKQQYSEQYSESKRSGEPLFLAGEADYKSFGLSPAELGYLESKKTTLRDVCVLTDVPKVLLNDIEEMKYDNAEAALNMFLKETIRPLMTQLCTKLNEKEELVPLEYELNYIDPAPINSDEILKANESGIKNYYMTINEARKNIDLEPISGGDVLLVPFSVTRLEDLGNKIGQNYEDIDNSGEDDTSNDDKKKSLKTSSTL